MLKMQVIGHLGKDAVVKDVNGKSVINFSLAHTEKLRDGEQKTVWVDCAYWTVKTGIAPYLKKGTQIYADGTPEVRSFPKNDGTTGISLVLRVGQIHLLGGNGQQQQPGGFQTGQISPRQHGTYETERIEDLPF